ncbi:MAG: hypothetical protein NC416_08190 [Eubacterium sp.]|nr:hypothetical protein [Eubacterium sp.]
MVWQIEPYQATLDAIEKRLKEVGEERNMHRILRKAVNEVAGVGKEQLHKETKAYYTIKSKAFKKSDIEKKATSSKHPGATITVKGEPIGVKAGYATRKNGKRKGAKVQVLAKSTMQEIQVEHNGHAYKAFMATMTNTDSQGNETTHTGIFQRVPGKYMKKYQPIKDKTKGREKIKEIYSLSKAKAGEIAYVEEGNYYELSGELVYRLLKNMNAIIEEAKAKK